MADEHYHEITLDDGTMLTTGPPIGEPAGEEEMPPAADAAAPPMPPAPAYGPGKRKGILQRAAKSEDERALAMAAMGARRFQELPEYGRYVYGSMFESTLQQFGKSYGDRAEAYASGVAWRAVGQAYGIPTEPTASKSFRGANVVRPGLRPLVAQPAPRSSKAVGVNGVSSEGGTWVVQVSGSRNASKFYTRVVPVSIPGSGGVVVTVGISRPQSRRHILDVRVPKRIVSDTPGGMDAYGWVYRNIDQLRRIVTREIGPFPPDGPDLAKSATRQIRGCKFVTSPELAKNRVTYDVVYPAWKVDLQGQYATAEQVQKMAHAFMRNRGGTNLMHVTGLKMDDGEPAGSFVESYVSAWGDPNFPPDSWIGGVEWHPQAWKRVLSGEIKGYSIEGKWGVVPLELVMEEAA
jgi:hypothetical protein